MLYKKTIYAIDYGFSYATFGDRYALRIQSRPGEGTATIMTVPNLRGEAVGRELAWSV